MSSGIRQCVVVFVFAAAVHGVAAAAPIEVRPLQFARGATSAVVKGSIKGDHTIDYQVRARAGQSMSVALKTSSSANYFNVLPPNSETALFVGSTSGNEWTGVLPVDGQYTVRVYLMRSAARRNEAANYSLTVGIAGQPTTAAQASQPKAAGASSVDRAAQGQFNATGQVPCAQAKGQPTQQCPFGVAREAGGTATVVVTLPDGRKRAIFFTKGKATGADLSQADGNMSFRASKNADLFMIDAGNERYEIPDAVVFGG